MFERYVYARDHKLARLSCVCVFARARADCSHGELGHEVSKFCAEQLPALLIANAEKLAEDPEAILRGAVMELDNILFEDEQMRETAKFSGSTATLVRGCGDEKLRKVCS
eukprot:5164332-Pleurochrysis_carterae.AAC.1